MDSIQFTPALIWDIALAAVIVISIGVGLYRGLASELAYLAGTIASLVAAAVFSKPVALWVYETFLANRLEANLLDSMTTTLSGFIQLLEQVGLGDKLQNVTNDLVRSLMVALLTVVVFFLIYLLAKLIVRLIISLTKKVNEVPVLGTVNRLLGGALGMAEGLAICYIIGLGVTLLISFSHNEWNWINSGIVAETRVLDWFLQVKLPFKL